MSTLNVNIPEGSAADWRVEKFTVSEAEAKLFNLRCAFQPGGGHRSIKPGEYTRLMRGQTVVMSDTPAEARDHWPIIHKANGSVLVNGLGLGMCLTAILRKTEVCEVTVVEKSPEVIALVSPHISDPRLEIINDCAFEYMPPKGKRYNAVWHDIWDDICADNLVEMRKLHRKYGRRTDWQGSWCRAECEMGQ